MSSQKSDQPLGSVLVVGGCGFLGHHIIKQLASLHPSPTKISVLDLTTTRNRLPSVTYYDGDISKSKDVERVYEDAKPQIIIHTASPTINALDKSIYYRVNVHGTRCLLETAGKMGYTKVFVYTSSPSVIHDGVSNLVMVDESMPILEGKDQPEPYSLTKGIAEKIVLAANRKYNNMTTCAIRPSSMFGPADAQLLPSLLKTYEQGKTKFQLGDNTNLFDFTFVRNVAHAHVLAAQKLLGSSGTETVNNEGKVDGEAFVITNDEPWHFWTFTRAVYAAAGDKTKPEQIWVIPAAVGLIIAGIIEWLVFIFSLGSKTANFTRAKIRYSTITRTFNIEKAKSRLGYEPIVKVSDGIMEGVEWFQKNGMVAKKEQ